VAFRRHQPCREPAVERARRPWHRQVSRARDGFGHDVRSIGSGGEPLGAELLGWGRVTFGVTINEFYGQTECNLVIANRATLMEVRPGSMGRAVPGHEVAVVDEDGQPVATGVPGQLAIRRPDPVMFLEYWNQPEATERKFAGDWLLTGDTGRLDEDGYAWFSGRDDDVITSRRLPDRARRDRGLPAHAPAIAMAAVVGVPDPDRTERIKAFVVLRDGVVQGDAALADAVRDHVRRRLAAHEYPREVEFVAELPLTTTGKVMRRILRDRERQRTVATAGAGGAPAIHGAPMEERPA
jgi:acetyl-CoA synthetase